MIIQVTDDYRIASDEHSWIVQRIKRYGPDTKSAEQGITEKWESITWHPTLAQAGQSLSERLWRVCEPGEGETVGQAIERLNALVLRSVEASEVWQKMQEVST